MTHIDVYHSLIFAMTHLYPTARLNQPSLDALAVAADEIVAANREPEPIAEPAPVVLDAIPGWEAA